MKRHEDEMKALFFYILPYQLVRGELKIQLLSDSYLLVTKQILTYNHGLTTKINEYGIFNLQNIKSITKTILMMENDNLKTSRHIPEKRYYVRIKGYYFVFLQNNFFQLSHLLIDNVKIRMLQSTSLLINGYDNYMVNYFHFSSYFMKNKKIVN